MSSRPLLTVTRAQVERALFDGFIAAPGARLRDEDQTKVDELVALLTEVGRVVRRWGHKRPLVLVDAAAGKGYVGVLAAKLVLGPLQRAGEVLLLDRNGRLLAEAEGAARRLGVGARLRTACGDVGDLSLWPEAPALVVALHACADAADRVLEAAVARRAAHLLVVPCCVGKTTRGAALASSVGQALALPRSAPIQRQLLHAVVDGERLLRLEAAGYQAEALEVVPAHVSPYNTLLRARRVLEPVRQARSAQALATLRRVGSASS